MALDYAKLKNEFLQKHLQYVDNTEPPRIFHVWAALACASACMQRHVYLDTGIGRIFGNMYVLLVGPPATKKSSAIKFANQIVSASTHIKYAPDDTGGQRQGLMTAMLEDDEIELSLEDAKALDPAALMDLEVKINNDDRHCMFAVASEFGSLIGENNRELLRFLIKAWDGDDYKYQLNATRKVIEKSLIALVGGTTPSDIADLMPPQAIGQGFTSRIIFVYAGTKEKTVPISKAGLRTDLEPDLQKVYANIFHRMRGSMVLNTDASSLIDKLELLGCKIHDTRFMYYSERRPTHIIKMSMVLAAARGSYEIAVEDVQTAQMILEETEKHMPDALGEYGLSKVAVARQKMLEYLRFADTPVSEKFLWGIMQRDMQLVDFKNSISALIHADKITPVDTQDGRHYVFKSATARLMSTLEDDVINTLLETDADESRKAQSAGGGQYQTVRPLKL